MTFAVEDDLIAYEHGDIFIYHEAFSAGPITLKIKVWRIVWPTLKILFKPLPGPLDDMTRVNPREISSFFVGPQTERVIPLTVPTGATRPIRGLHLGLLEGKPVRDNDFDRNRQVIAGNLDLTINASRRSNGKAESGEPL